MKLVDLAPHNPYGLTLASPVLTAAGCFGYGVEYTRVAPFTHLGAIVTAGTTLHGRSRLRASQLTETPAGLLSSNWVGRSFATVQSELAPVWAGWATPVILNVVGDYVAIARALEGLEGIAGLELLLDDPATAAATTAAVRAATPLPLLAKLPIHDALATTAQALAAAGADALTLIAPPPARSYAADQTAVVGWLSGPAIRPLALQAVAAVRAVVQLPIIGCGGIASTSDAQQFLAAGATAVQIGAALLADPLLAERIATELQA